MTSTEVTVGVLGAGNVGAALIELIDAHGEIFDADWWRAVQRAITRGDNTDIPPYPASARLQPANPQ